MPQSQTTTWLDFALQQMAAESYLNDSGGLLTQLTRGNNRFGFDPPTGPLPGATRFTNVLADRFIARYDIVDHHASDATGFSATLMKDLTTGQYTLSFRSLEYQNQVDGGDWERDGLPGAAGEIAGTGFALAQLVSMERYYRELKISGILPQNAMLNVTGYSLGGHLATVFTQLHANDVTATYTFNGAGRGGINGGTSGLSETERIQEMLQFAEEQMLNWDSTGDVFRSGNGGNIYDEQWYEGVWGQTVFQFRPTSSFLPPGQIGLAPGFEKITQLVGQATHNDQPFVANSGIHARPTTIFIEDQPNVDGSGGLFGQSGSFGTTHSITLLVDSLALMELFQQVDGTLTQTTIEGIFAAASSQTGSGVVGFAGLAEGNSLENALDAVRRVFDPNAASTPSGRQTGDFGSLAFRNQFYTNINQVKNLVASGLFSIDSLVDMSSGSIASQARNNSSDGMAYRYALQELIPLAIRGVDYGALHNDGPADSRPLDLYDAQTGQGTWTALALSDRAGLLAKRLQFNLNNGGTTPADTHYLDVQTEFEVGDISSTNEMIFGDDRVGDVLVGHAGDDHLYGRDGADTIEGNEGRDYIEGGLGNDPRLSGGAGNDIILGQQGDDQLYGEADHDRLNGGLGNDFLDGGTGRDTYFYRTGQGNDRIVDADKIGTVVFDNQALVGGIRREGAPVNTYTSHDGQFTYVKSGMNLIINNTLTIENFDFTNGALGIKLADTGDLASPDLPVQGPVTRIWTGTAGEDDLGAVPFQDNHFITGGFGNDYIDGWTGDDQLYGEGDNDFIFGGQGRDALYGGDGLDRLEGDGTTNALPAAGGVVLGLPDQDYLDGGAGDDVLLGYDYGDVLLGGDGEDQLLGDDYPALLGFGYPEAPGGRPVGEDYLDGGIGVDLLFGGLGDDRLLGGEGADELHGDNVTAGGWYEFGYVQSGDFLLFAPIFNPTGRLARFTAEGGADYLDGGAGHDILIGDGGDDILSGGADNDQLFGDDLSTNMVIQGADWLEGGVGDDQLMGGGGVDALFGGDGNDLLVGDFSDNPTLGADDTLDGGAGDDQILGGGGHDLLEGGLGNDLLLGDDGEDSLFGGEGLDQLQGGLGDDALDGEAGDDLLLGGEGSDMLFGGAGVDELQGGDGDDELAGEAGDDFLLGDAGNDTLFGDDGADRLQGGAGDDIIGGDAGNDGLFGEDGADTLFGDEGNDEFLGGAGNDVHDGGSGSDVYLFNLGDGQDDIFEEDVIGDVNTILFGPGITREMLTFTQNVAQETLLIQVDTGSDSILIHGFRNTGVNGTSGMQNIVAGGQSFSLADLLGLPSGQIVGTAGNDVIRTGIGNDTIFAGAGDDAATGNAGNDQLVGGLGEDTYFFNLGDGLDTINDTATTGEGNRIVFGAGITAGDLVYTQSANTLTIAYNGLADAVQLVGFSQNTLLGSLVVSTLQFSDSSAVNLAVLFPSYTNQVPTVSNAVADQTTVEDAPWTFVVPANAFADQDAGEVLTLSATLADGTALPGWLSFDAGTRTFSGTPDDAQVGTLGLRVRATDGRDEAADTFNLTITNVNDAPTVAAPLLDQAATKEMPFTFIVPAGAFSDVDLGDSLAYSATLTDNSVLPSWLIFNPSTRTFSGTPQSGDVGTINVKVMATDTGSLSTSDIFALTVTHGLNEITGTTEGETLTGTAGNDLIRGLGGSDALSGLDGNDTLEGGDGDDYLNGGLGNDTLDGGAGNDQLHAGTVGETGNNVLIGGVGADVLTGYTGNDTFQGGPGNDTIFDPYGGQDVYLFDRGDGQDTLAPHRGTVRFAPGVLPTDVTVRGSSDLSLVLSINGTTDTMTLSGWANPFNGTQIDRVEFADGTVWNAAILQAKAAVGTVGNDYLRGTSGNDVLLGLGGNDLIEALDGDDVLDGGMGNDTLRAGLGNDIYVFGRGYGVDLLQDAGGTADTIQLAEGIVASDVSLLRNGNDLLLSIDQSPTHLQMSSAASIERITFNDGTFWDAAAILSHTVVGAVNSMTGTAGNDTFVVDHTLDTVTEAANQGTDTIQSLVTYTLPDHVENLTLTSYFNVDGTGNLLDNVILGNSGNNKLIGSVNDYNGGGSDILQGGAGDDSYTVIGNADTVIEAPNEGNDTITLFGDANRGWNYALPDHVENLIVTTASEVFFQDRDFFGNALDNVISGDPDWLNYIDGGLGADTMIGGRLGNTYIVDNLGDTVRDTHTGVDSGLNLDIVLSSVTFTLGSNLENLTLTGTAAISGTGNELHNVLTGNSAVNVLTGGAGDDTYVIGAGDTIVELAGQGTDTVSTDQSVTLSGDLENVTLTGTAAIDATGNALDNVLTGNSANNMLDGGAGADQLIGGAGNDTYYVGAGDTVTEQLFGGTDTVIADQTFTLSNDLENLTLMGTAVINGTGNASDNILTGNSAANVLTGGTGNDTYVVDGADTIVENVGEGTDTVQASGSWVLASDLENLTLVGAEAINGTGNTRNNVLAGNSGANILTGGAGDDTYHVGSGDTIIELANEGTDTVLSGASFTLASDLEHLTLTGTATIDGTGNAQNNILIGNVGANLLNGGAGADSMSGDAGDDIYAVDNVGDTVTENSAAGIDTVQSSITHTLGTNVENLTLIGATAINGTGNSLANVLTGNSAANTLTGGTGNDTYIVGAGDTVTEAASAGTDMVQSSVTFTLGSNIEYLTLTGTAAINGTGNTLNNTLIGNSANNVLSGGTGNDTMSGGSGSDIYVVNAVGDVVTELVNEGTDTVQSAVTWTLGANIENLTLTGTSAINGTGNVLDNTLVGNSAANTLTGGAGNDTLDGGAGNDTMVGGTGNDTFVVNATGDVVTEQANEGTDTVLSAVTRTLGANFEHLTLTGTTAINGTGNTLNNVLTGNSAANVLTGGAGNDTYVVGTGDTVTEAASAGMDVVHSAVTWTLGANLENLTLTGTAAINGTGNTLNNVLTGNSANNVLTGLGGNDTYHYSRGGGQDTVVDNAGTTDMVRFGATINPLDLVLSRQVNNLRLAVHGSSDQVTIQNWYGGSTNQTETIQAGNGQTMLSTQVDQLIQAMAGFTAQTGLTWDQAIDQRPQDVQTVLAASWQ